METVFSVMVSITVLTRTVERLFMIVVVITIRSVWFERLLAFAIFYEAANVVLSTSM
jgi:hypothetical protein